MKHGISVDAMNPYGRPRPTLLKQLGVDGVRMVAFPDPMWYVYYRELEAAGLEIALVYTGQSFVGERSMYEQAQDYARTVNPVASILCNEWNDESLDAHWPKGGKSAFVAVYNEIGAGIRSVRPDAYLATGGLYSMRDPRPLLREVLPQLDPYPNAIGYHPYLEGYASPTPEGYEGTLQLFSDLTDEFRLPIVADEWNDSSVAVVRGKKSFGLTKFQQILEQTTSHSMWFCYSDLMVADHGVIDAGGKRKDLWYGLQEAYRG